MTLWRLGVVAASKAGVAATPAGYLAFGEAASGSVSTVSRILYSTDVISTLSTSGLVARQYAAAFESTTNGYFAGGSSDSSVSKLVFAGETISNQAGTLQSSRGYIGGCRSSTFGYVFGGAFPATSNVDKYTFSTDTSSTLGTGLPSVRYNTSGAYESSTHGYVSGGYGGSPLATLTETVKFAFSNDARSAPAGAALNPARQNMAGVASSTAGYLGGGFPQTSAVVKITFSDDSRSNLGNLLSVDRSGRGGVESTLVAYFAGGRLPRTSVVDKFTFSSESSSALLTGLAAVVDGSAGASSSKS